MKRRTALKRIAAAGIVATGTPGVVSAAEPEDCIQPFEDPEFCSVRANPSCDSEDCPEECCFCLCER